MRSSKRYIIKLIIKRDLDLGGRNLYSLILFCSGAEKIRFCKFLEPHMQVLYVVNFLSAFKYLNLVIRKENLIFSFWVKDRGD